MNGFTQVPCPKCNAPVYVAQPVGYGVCPSCHTQTSAAPSPGQGPMGPGPMGPIPVVGPTATYGGSIPQRGRPVAIFAAIAVALAGGVAFGVIKGVVKGPGKGRATYASVGLDSGKPDADKMITSVASLAKKWRSDAIWWSVNFQEVHADGTVDLSNGAVVEYIAPGKVSSVSRKVREDSIKKFTFGSSSIDYSKQWNAINQWKGVEEPPAPKCSIHDLTKKLADKGLTGTKTVRVSFDPQFDWGDDPTWHVTGQDPKIDARYSMKSCDEVSNVKGGGHASSEDE